MKIKILPNSDFFKSDTRIGGSFKLINDDIHYLSIDKSVFNNIQQNYTIELWFKVHHFSIIIKKNEIEVAQNPSLLMINQNNGKKLHLQCDPQHILLNDQKITQYQPGQWIQLCLAYGETGTLNSTLSCIYMNGSLIQKNNYLLPSININNLNENNSFIGKKSNDNNYSEKYVLLNYLDDQQLEWSIMKIYNTTLNNHEIERNFFAHSQRFAINRYNPHPIIIRNLVSYFDAGDSRSYKHPEYYLNNIAPLFDIQSVEKNKSIKNIYNSHCNMDNNYDIQELSKLISQLLARNNFSKQSLALELAEKDRNQKLNQDISKIIITQPNNQDLIYQINIDQLKNNPIKMRNVLMHFEKNPQHFIDLIQTNNPNLVEKKLIFDLINDQSSSWVYNQDIKQNSIKEIKSNPTKLAILQQFFINQPDIFLDVLAKAQLTQTELNDIYSLVARRNTISTPPNKIIIDTFDSSDGLIQNNKIVSLQKSIDQLNQLINELRKENKYSQNENTDQINPQYLQKKNYPPISINKPEPHMLPTFPYRESQQSPNQTNYQSPNQTNYQSQNDNYSAALQQQYRQLLENQLSNTRQTPGDSPFLIKQDQDPIGMSNLSNNQNSTLTNKILNELKQIRNEMKKTNNPKTSHQSNNKLLHELPKINNLELQLQKLMQSDIITDKNNQIQLFQLIKIFQQLKNNILFNSTQETGDHTYDLLKGRLSQLESQFQNMAKACLHAPNILGYMSDGQQHIGLIDKKGQIDYINQSARNIKPHYIALRNSQTPKQPMTLPAVVDYISQPQNKDHKLVGQVTDSSQHLSIGLIMENQNKQYLLLISPIPKLLNIPVMAITLSQKKNGAIQQSQQAQQQAQQAQQAQQQPPITSTQQSCPSQKCLPGLQPSVYQADANWIPQNLNQNRQNKEKIQILADSFDPQILTDPQFNYLDSL